MVIFGESKSFFRRFSVSLVDRISRFCKEQHISETRFAREAGLAKGLLPKWKQKPEDFIPHQDSLRKVAARMNITVEDLMNYIKAPDFPTGGTIYGYQGVRDAFETGRGRIVIRSNADIETDDNGREKIIITELPYGVVKSDLVKNIAELVNDKKIEGIADINDHSKRDIRIVVDVKRDANAQVVLNKLYKFTALQSSFAVNNIALVKGRPMLLNLKQLIGNFIEHRMEVVTRRTLRGFDHRRR